MSGFKGDADCNKVLDFMLGNGTPSTLYLALYIVAPTSSGAATGTEVTGGGYARIAVTNNTTNFPNASSKTKSNGAAFDFGTASGDYGGGADIVWGAWVTTTSGAGDIKYAGPLTVVRKVLSGDDFKIPIGGFTATEA